jgi:putative ABC transport system substrate-binding protein
VRRRDFVAFLSGAAAWVSAARAQEPRQVIGVLGTVSYGTGLVVAFLQGLKNTDFSEGRNVDVEYRWAESHYERMPSLATELIGRDVAVIVTLDSPSAFAAKAATRTIPVVFVTGADPVKLGLVDSLNRPRGNLTGISFLVSVLAPKHLELLRELLPNSRRIALLVNPSNPNAKVDIPETQAAAHAFERHLEVLTASTENDLEAAFATMVQQRVDALIVKTDPFLLARRERLVALAARHAMPAIYPYRDFADVGGLMSYGTGLLELHREAGTYTGKILKGAKPADLPVQQNTKFELVINLKTAKALGLVVPATLLARADEVIE